MSGSNKGSPSVIIHTSSTVSRRKRYSIIDSNIILKINAGKITRGHDFTLVIEQSILDARKYSFSQRTINVRNKLLTDCSVNNMFKNIIDKYLVRMGYTSLSAAI